MSRAWSPDAREKVLPSGVVGVEGANQLSIDPTTGMYFKKPCKEEEEVHVENMVWNKIPIILVMYTCIR